MLSRSDRLADALTRVSGSMSFVYVHALLFAVWVTTGLFGFDRYPFQFLTLVVSLEAIFLATFVLISQNRQANADRAVLVEDHALDLETLLLLKALITRLEKSCV